MQKTAASFKAENLGDILGVTAERVGGEFIVRFFCARAIK
jgi:hypothetical protein